MTKGTQARVSIRRSSRMADNPSSRPEVTRPPYLAYDANMQRHTSRGFNITDRPTVGIPTPGGGECDAHAN